MRSTAIQSSKTSGFSIAETTMSTLLVSLLLATSLGTLSQVTSLQNRDHTRLAAAELALELLSEAQAKCFLDPLQPNPNQLGPSPAESTQPRSMWNDCDDYHGLTLDPITKPDGSPIAWASGWSATFQVTHVNGDLDTSTIHTDLKRIRLTLISPAGASYVFDALRSRYGALQNPDFYDYLSASEIEFRSGSTSQSTSVRLLNQQAP